MSKLNDEIISFFETFKVSYTLMGRKDISVLINKSIKNIVLIRFILSSKKSNDILAIEIRIDGNKVNMIFNIQNKLDSLSNDIDKLKKKHKVTVLGSKIKVETFSIHIKDIQNVFLILEKYCLF
jgi:hypothetical protein